VVSFFAYLGDYLVGAELAEAHRACADEHAGRVGAAGIASANPINMIDDGSALDDPDELR